MATYLELIQEIKNIRNAITLYYNTGNRNRYLKKSYINSVINDIETFINETTWDYDSIDKLYYLRQTQRNLYGIERIPEFFTDDTISSNYIELMNSIKDNFVLLPL